jgi:NitT/TauT family transport system ATP-binding protein
MSSERAPVVLESRPEISLAGVSKSYGQGHKAVQAVDRIDLDIRRNEFISFLGPSGCGKSTLMLMIAGLIEPTSGAICIEGRKIVGPQRSTGIVFQDPVLLPWRTVLDNILLPIELMGENVQSYLDHALELLDMSGIADFADRLPNELSGGMRQRAGICRALVQYPTLLLMDEPFSALDAMTRDDMNLELLRIWERDRKTVVFITHSISEAIFLSDRVIVMSKRPGRIIEDITIALPRPRSIELQETMQFAQLRARVRQRIEH